MSVIFIFIIQLFQKQINSIILKEIKKKNNTKIGGCQSMKCVCGINAPIIQDTKHH